MQERQAECRQLEDRLLPGRRTVQAYKRNLASVADHYPRLARLELEPVPCAKEAFEFRVLVAHARSRTRVVGLVQTELGSRLTVLPDAIGTRAHPAFGRTVRREPS